jgi:hypothetical protein
MTQNISIQALTILQHRNGLRGFLEGLQSVEHKGNSGVDANLSEILKRLESAEQYLSALIDSEGYPTDTAVGKEAASAAWELVLAISSVAEDSFFADKVISGLRASLDHAFPTVSNYAFLVDHGSVRKNGWQVYGSMWGIMPGAMGEPIWFPVAIDNIEALEDRRSALGLKPLYSEALVRAGSNPSMIHSYLPSSYLLNYLEDPKLPDEPEDRFPPMLNTASVPPKWQTVMDQLLRRAGRLNEVAAEAEQLKRENAFNDSTARSFSSETSKLVNDNFAYLLSVCRDPDLGFPTDKMVSREAAVAAIRIFAMYAGYFQEGLPEVLEALSNARREGRIAEVPSTDSEMAIMDAIFARQHGMQQFGSAWDPCPALPNYLVPLPIQRDYEVDQRRASFGAQPLYQAARILELTSGVVALLPLTYVAATVGLRKED